MALVDGGASQQSNGYHDSVYFEEGMQEDQGVLIALFRVSYCSTMLTLIIELALNVRHFAPAILGASVGYEVPVGWQSPHRASTGTGVSL